MRFSPTNASTVQLSPSLLFSPSQTSTARRPLGRHLPARRNGVVLYHEILSFHPEDRERLTPALLEDLARQWLALRAPQALAYGRVHYDRGHVHVHLLLSANGVHSPRRIRLSRAAFGRAKRELERYQIEHYPQLVHSRQQIPRAIRPPNRQTIRGQGRELEGIPVLGVPPAGEGLRPMGAEAPGVSPPPSSLSSPRSPDPFPPPVPSPPPLNARHTRKQALQQAVLEALSRARGEDAFRRILAEQGIPAYDRGGRLYGVVLEGRRHRLKTLGLEDAFLAAQGRWQRQAAARESLQRIAAQKLQRRLRAMGFAGRVREVLGQAFFEEGGLAFVRRLKRSRAGVAGEGRMDGMERRERAERRGRKGRERPGRER